MIAPSGSPHFNFLLLFNPQSLLHRRQFLYLYTSDLLDIFSHRLTAWKKPTYLLTDIDVFFLFGFFLFHSFFFLSFNFFFFLHFTLCCYQFICSDAIFLQKMLAQPGLWLFIITMRQIATHHISVKTVAVILPTIALWIATSGSVLVRDDWSALYVG